MGEGVVQGRGDPPGEKGFPRGEGVSQGRGGLPGERGSPRGWGGSSLRNGSLMRLNRDLKIVVYGKPLTVTANIKSYFDFNSLVFEFRTIYIYVLYILH